MRKQKNKLRQLAIRAATSALLCTMVINLCGVHAATITVTSLQDNGPGTLRDALAAAADGDTIDATGLYGPIKLIMGELVVDKKVDIRGPGPDKLTVDGNGLSRVFHVTNATKASISGLTITKGSDEKGGGILNDRGNVFNAHIDLTVSNCTISGNRAYESGGGIYNNDFLTVIASTISGNYAQGNGDGIENEVIIGPADHRATLTVIASTISSNFASGIDNTANATAMIMSSTFSGNGGFAINNFGDLAYVVVSASTLSGDFGIHNYHGSLEIGDTIMNLNTNCCTNCAVCPISIHNDYPGTVISDGYNLSSDRGGGVLIATGDQINTKPLLGPLADNGGLTKTHKLLTGSPAIDKGKRDSVFFLALDTDQRGLSPSVDFGNVANAPGGDGSDIGAYEVQTTSKLAADLGTTVQGLPILDGLKSALAEKVQVTENAIHSNDVAAAGATLGAFINQCNAQKSKKLTEEQATDLIDQATQIRTLIGYDRREFFPENAMLWETAPQE